MNITRQLVHNPPQNLMCVEVVNVSTIEDGLVEGNEEFTLSLSSTSFIVDVTTPTATVTIADDESEFPKYTISFIACTTYFIVVSIPLFSNMYSVRYSIFSSF